MASLVGQPPAPRRATSLPGPPGAEHSNLRSNSSRDLKMENYSISQAGPLSSPSNPEWRRQRLLRIGANSSPQVQSTNDQTTLLGDPMTASYGTLPRESARKKRRRSAQQGLAFLSLGGQDSNDAAENTGLSLPPSPTFRLHSRPSSFLKNFRRPVSAYDAMGYSNSTPAPGHSPDEEGARVNGIRVWYSSFTSIDWLHDAIKDSARMMRLRRRKSLRGRMTNLLDRSMGWIIVTIVGFLTAIIAFLIVRSEQLLFDFKEGYCVNGWWKAYRFCCPRQADISSLASASAARSPFASFKNEDTCDAWSTWSDVFSPQANPADPQVGEEGWVVEYLSYTIIALALASASSLLTIHLTASTSFITRKESGVLAPTFSSDLKDTPVQGAQRRKVLYFAAGSGIPEIKTILSGFVIHGYLGGRTLFTKSVGLSLSVASGLSLGKEGPFVHIASCVGNIVSRWFMKYETNEGKRREILSAASAAGVAVAFGAPIGGVLFSLEEVSYFFPPKVMWRSFFCAMVAATTLKFLDPFGTGKLVLFQVTYDKDWHAYELVPFLLLGVFGGIYGAYFSKLNYRWSKHVRSATWLKNHMVSEVVLVTLLTSALGFLNVYTRMGGTELVYNLFAECRPGADHSGLCVPYMGSPGPVIGAIALALLVKGGLTVITFGIKLPAGIFIPSLGVGACAGRILGLAIQHWQWNNPDSAIFSACHGDRDCIIPGIYAMVGAAATLSGVTRTTVSLAVIMFELTDSLTYVVPIMLSVLVAKTVADALEPKGIYDLVIELSQLPYLDHKQEYHWGAQQVFDVADRQVEVISVDRQNSVRNLRDQLQSVVSEGVVDGFPIINGSRKLIGYIGTNELEHALTILADDPEELCHFHPIDSPTYTGDATSMVSSANEHDDGRDPFDLTIYMDQAPLTVQLHAPLELVQQLFVKVGARYVIVTDPDGRYEGVIDKKSWIAFLGELEEKSK